MQAYNGVCNPEMGMQLCNKADNYLFPTSEVVNWRLTLNYIRPASIII